MVAARLRPGDVLVNCRDCEFVTIAQDMTGGYFHRDHHTQRLMNCDACPDHEVAVQPVRV